MGVLGRRGLQLLARVAEHPEHARHDQDDGDERPATSGASAASRANGELGAWSQTRTLPDGVDRAACPPQPRPRRDAHLPAATPSSSPGRPSPARAPTTSASPPTRRSARSSGRRARSRPRRRASRSPPRSRPGRTTGASRRSTPRDMRARSSPVASFVWSWPSTTTTSFTDLASAPEIVDPLPRLGRASPAPPPTRSRSTPRPTGPPARRSAATRSASGATRPRSARRTRRSSSSTTTRTTGASARSTRRERRPLEHRAVVHEDLRERAADPGAERQEPAPARATSATPLNGVDPSTVGYPLDDRRARARLESGSGRLRLPGRRHPVRGRRLRLVGERLRALGEVHRPRPRGRRSAPAGTASSRSRTRRASRTTSITLARAAASTYCARVRPVDRASTSSGPLVFGDWTYLPGNETAAFTFSGWPGAATCSPCSLAPSDYREPVTGSTVGRMPLFTWQPITGAQSYYVIVARDPSFTNVDRLRLHADPGLRAADGQPVQGLRGRAHALLLGRPPRPPARTAAASRPTRSPARLRTSRSARRRRPRSSRRRARSSTGRRPSAGRRPRARAATASRSRRIRASRTRSTRS